MPQNSICGTETQSRASSVIFIALFALRIGCTTYGSNVSPIVSSVVSFEGLTKSDNSIFPSWGLHLFCGPCCACRVGGDRGWDGWMHGYFGSHRSSTALAAPFLPEPLKSVTRIPKFECVFPFACSCFVRQSDARNVLGSVAWQVQLKRGYFVCWFPVSCLPGSQRLSFRDVFQESLSLTPESLPIGDCCVTEKTNCYDAWLRLVLNRGK